MKADNEPFLAGAAIIGVIYFTVEIEGKSSRKRQSPVAHAHPCHPNAHRYACAYSRPRDWGLTNKRGQSAVMMPIRHSRTLRTHPSLRSYCDAPQRSPQIDNITATMAQPCISY